VTASAKHEGEDADLLLGGTELVAALLRRARTQDPADFASMCADVVTGGDLESLGDWFISVGHELRRLSCLHDRVIGSTGSALPASGTA
jgi:hypothetical protein